MEELIVKKEKIRKVFLDELPRCRYGKGQPNGVIDWYKCAELRCKVRFIYDDIEGEFEIIDYQSKGQKLIIKYLDKEFKIDSTSFKNCKFGLLLNKRTNEFKVGIGQTFKDDKRDLTIIDRRIEVEDYGYQKYNRKYYKYKCNKCGFECGEHYKNSEYKEEYLVVEGDLIKGNGCSCCDGKIAVVGINDIPTTAPWMVKFFQGGYNEAKMYTPRSNQNIIPICFNCDRIKDKEISINQIYNGKSIGCNCGDNISYPEKFMFNVLEQLRLNFKTQLSKKDFKWISSYKYDFYFELNYKTYIIETHGEQHYEDGGYSKVKEVRENDKLKKELALSNGIKEENYIIVDCSKSDMDFIKCNIVNSRLNELFDLSNIDWLQCEEFALSNRVKEACELKRNNPDMTPIEISKIMKLNRTTITEYLKRGSKIWGWCNYDPKEEMRKTFFKKGSLPNNAKQIKIFKNGKLLGTFESCTELERQSEKLYGVKLLHSKISLVCNGKRPHYKGFTFKYVS